MTGVHAEPVACWRTKKRATGGCTRHRAARSEPAPAAPAVPDTTTMGPDGVQASWVMRENQRSGTDDWKITGTPPGMITGFADRTYAAAGDTTSLFVSTDAPRFHVEPYRM